jgi:ribonuclease HI
LGWSKINVDGSFVAETGAGGIGVVARDSDDKILMTAWSTLFQCTDAAEAEARACKEGLRLAGQWITGPVIIESDCARVVKALQGLVDYSDISFIIVESKDHGQLQVDCKVVEVERERERESNLVANELSHLARRNTHSVVWLGTAPACVLTLIKNDCNALV